MHIYYFRNVKTDQTHVYTHNGRISGIYQYQIRRIYKLRSKEKRLQRGKHKNRKRKT